MQCTSPNLIMGGMLLSASFSSNYLLLVSLAFPLQLPTLMVSPLPIAVSAVCHKKP